MKFIRKLICRYISHKIILFRIRYVGNNQRPKVELECKYCDYKYSTMSAGMVIKAMEQKDDFVHSQTILKRSVIIEKWLYENWKLRKRQQKIFDDEFSS